MFSTRKSSQNRVSLSGNHSNAKPLTKSWEPGTTKLYLLRREYRYFSAASLDSDVQVVLGSVPVLTVCLASFDHCLRKKWVASVLRCSSCTARLRVLFASCGHPSSLLSSYIVTPMLQIKGSEMWRRKRRERRIGSMLAR